MPKFHHRSAWGSGPRIPMDRERRAVWRARLIMHRRAGRLTALHAEVGLALLRRLGQDGRLDPSHATIAQDAGAGVRTVRRALERLAECGLTTWVRRLVRVGWRAAQAANAYVLTLGEASTIPTPRCDGQRGRETLKDRFITDETSRLDIPEDVRAAAQAALAARRAAIEGLLLKGRPTWSA